MLVVAAGGAGRLVLELVGNGTLVGAAVLAVSGTVTGHVVTSLVVGSGTLVVVLVLVVVVVLVVVLVELVVLVVGSGTLVVVLVVSTVVVGGSTCWPVYVRK